MEREKTLFYLLVPPEYIPCIYLLLHVIQTSVIAVCNNSLTLRFENV